MMLTKQELHIPITADDKTAVDWLAESSKLSRQKLKQCMQKGCVWLERVKSDSSDGSADQLITTQLSYIKRLRRAKKSFN